MVERSLSTLVQPCYMRLYEPVFFQRRGRVSDFVTGSLGSIPSRGKGDKHFFTCYIVSIYVLLCEKSPVQVKEPFFFP